MIQLFVCAICLSQSILCLPLQAQENIRQFDETIYQLSSSWKQGKTEENWTTLYHEEVSRASIRIFRATSVPRSVKKRLQRKIRGLFDADDRDDIDSWNYKSGTLNGRKWFSCGTRVGREIRIGIAQEVKQRLFVSVLSLRVPRQIDGSEIKKLSSEFVQFCMDQRFIAEGAKPLLGPPTRGELNGVFWKTAYRTNLDLSLSFEQDFYLFSSSGRFFRGLPADKSVKSFDFDDAVKSVPDKAGNYIVQNEKVILNYATGRQDSETIATENSKGLKRAMAPADGSMLEGLYVDFHYSGFSPGSSVKGGVSSQKTFNFSKTGEFESNRFSGAFGNFESNGSTTGGFANGVKAPIRQGTYEIKGGALVLKLSDGRKAICSIVQIGEKLIFINGSRYLMQEKRH